MSKYETGNNKHHHRHMFRTNEPAHQVTFYAKIHSISISLNEDGTRATGYVVLDIRGMLTEEMPFIATAWESHWDIHRENPTQRFYLDARDSELHARVIQIIRRKIDFELSARKSNEIAMKYRELIEVAA